MKKTAYTSGQRDGASFGVTVALEDARQRGDISVEDCRYLTPFERKEYVRLAKKELNIEADVFFLEELEPKRNEPEQESNQEY